MAITLNIENKIAVLCCDCPGSKVNILSAEVLNEFEKILDELKQKSGIEALLLTSAKKDIFFAGADIKEIESIQEPEEGEKKARYGQDIFNKLADLPFPTIAVIDGVALGGGCEIALACDYRVATENEKVQIGLPEVKLGIFPGFGGTYRLPRLIGLQQALAIILMGKSVPSRKAHKIGLVDRLVPQAALKSSLDSFVNEVKGTPHRKKNFAKRKSNLLNLFLENCWPGQEIVFAMARRNVQKVSKNFYPAPLKAIEVMRRTIHDNREAGMDVEAREFSYMAVTPESKNLIHVFNLSTRFKNLSIPQAENIPPKTINKCGVIGAGIMGGGIAQLLSYKNITVRLKDINYQAIAQGLQAASKVFQKAAKKRKVKKHEVTKRMAQITGTIDESGFSNVDCVIEAVVEKMEIKKKVFKDISQIVPEDAILCSNTSSLSVTEMAKASKDPGRVIGFHFFNPVHRMPLVEIITTEFVSDQTIVTALILAKRLGKTPIIVKDTPGFLVNRILLSYLNEAGRLLEEGAGMTFVDQVMTDFGMPMGPFTLADEVGNDVGLKVLRVLHEGLGERFKPVGIFEKVFEANLLGKKAGKGFYIHKKKRVPNPQIQQWQSSHTSSGISAEMCRNRMIFIMINEAALCLEEGVVEDPATVDIGMVMGTGFPPFRGGLLKYADDFGLDSIVEISKLLKGQLNSDRFSPAPYLLKFSQNKGNFYNGKK